MSLLRLHSRRLLLLLSLMLLSINRNDAWARRSSFVFLLRTERYRLKIHIQRIHMPRTSLCPYRPENKVRRIYCMTFLSSMSYGENTGTVSKRILQDCPWYCEPRRKYWTTDVTLKHKLYGHRDGFQITVGFTRTLELQGNANSGTLQNGPMKMDPI